MRVRVLLQITEDAGASGAAEEIAAFEEATERPEDLGLLIAEGKALLAAVQHKTVLATGDRVVGAPPRLRELWATAAYQRQLSAHLSHALWRRRAEQPAPACLPLPRYGETKHRLAALRFDP